MKKIILLILFFFNIGFSFVFSCATVQDSYTLAPSSYFRHQEKTEFRAPDFDPEDYEEYQRKQAEFEENIKQLLNKEVTLSWKERYGDPQSVSGLFKEISTDRYGRSIAVVEGPGGEFTVYVSELVQVKSFSLVKSSGAGVVRVGFSDELRLENFPSYFPQEVFKDSLADKLNEIAHQVSPLAREFQIQKISYISEGTIKKVFRVEAMTDQGLKVFGVRMIQPSGAYFPSARYIEGAIEEINRFGELRELNGVAIDIKSFYSYEDFPNTLSMNLLGNCIYGMSIGEYVEGDPVDQIEGETHRREAYREAVKTVLRTWLLTVNSYGQGYTIGDLKGANMIKVSEKLYESMSPVVFIDFGDIQSMNFIYLKNHILAFLRNELGLKEGDLAEREYITLMRDYIDEFLREKGDSLKQGAEKNAILQAAGSLMGDYPYLSENHIFNIKVMGILSVAA